MAEEENKEAVEQGTQTSEMADVTKKEERKLVKAFNNFSLQKSTTSNKRKRHEHEQSLNSPKVIKDTNNKVVE